jgi:hypothetical protein
MSEEKDGMTTVKLTEGRNTFNDGMLKFIFRAGKLYELPTEEAMRLLSKGDHKGKMFIRARIMEAAPVQTTVTIEEDATDSVESVQVDNQTGNILRSQDVRV